jgi:hypothetical protein
MKFQWFKRKGIFFIPKSLTGWAISLLGVIYTVYIFIDIDSRSHSASDTLRPFFIHFLLIGLVYTLIAFLTSSGSTDKKDGTRID